MSGRLCLDALLLAAALGPGAALASEPKPAACPPGETIQWIADYCMASLETDDEIAASACITRESDRAFRSACAAKLHYKRAWCEALVRTSARAGTAEQCAADATAVGPTVERGGVGG